MKRSISLLLVASLAYNLHAYTIKPPPLHDVGVTYLDITPYSTNNPALWDYSGQPYTRQFFFTLETSTNLTNWTPACTVTGWCNNHHMMLAAYTNDVLAAACYGPVVPYDPVGQEWLAECIVALVVITIGVAVGIQLKGVCDRCLPATTTPSTPPATNSSSINLPSTNNNKSGFYRIKQ